jgi:acetolactate synthase-1/3 small subunit
MATHIISAFVENRHGALSRVANLFSSRGYNIESLTVAATEDASVSRMTIVVGGDKEILEQVVKQLNKLIDVIKVLDFADEAIIDRELLLVRIDTTKAGRTELFSLVSVYGGRIAAVSPTSVTVELSGISQSIDDFVQLIRPFGIKELVRTGKVAMSSSRK